MTNLDYIVLKPKLFDLGNGGEMLEEGTRIPGELVDSWGNGRTKHHLIENGILAPVPAEAGVANSATAFPRHLGFGKYELSDGSEIKGKDAAIAAEAALVEVAV